MHLSLQERKQEKEAQMLANVREALSNKNGVRNGDDDDDDSNDDNNDDNDDNDDNSDINVSNVKKGPGDIDVTESDDSTDESADEDNIITLQSVKTDHLPSSTLNNNFLIHELPTAPIEDVSDDEVVDLSMFGV